MMHKYCTIKEVAENTILFGKIDGYSSIERPMNKRITTVEYKDWQGN